MSQQFQHLHGHSYFSNHNQPDALCSPQELVNAAVMNGLDSMCLTDHASVMGIPKLVSACKDAGIKPIIGTELYVTNNLDWRPADKTDKSRRKYKHLVALATNWDGFIELMGLLSKANEEDHFYYRPRNSLSEVAMTENVVFLTACAGGLLCDDEWKADLDFLYNKLGAERLYLEIQPHIDDAQFEVNRRAVQARAMYPDLKLVATQDFHYARPGQNVPHEVLLASGQHKTWTSPDRWRYPVDDLYVKSTNEMLEAFTRQIKLGVIEPSHVTEAVMTTIEVAAKLNVEWRKIPISLPKMSDDPERTLMEMCIAQMKERGFMGKPEYVERLMHEFEVLKSSGFLPYFLVLEDITTWCRTQNIMVGPARGSSGGSLICYLIGITQLDPIYHGLLFERFYRPGRLDLPDIDTDFEDERRGEVLTYIRERFGDEFVAGVANYNTLKAKGAIKDTARVFEVDHVEANRATSPVDNNTEDEEVFEADTVKPFLAKHPLIEQNARQLCGVMKGMGQHAAGVVIAGVPLRDRTVIWRKDDRAIACWDKRVIEDMGLMKLDVLGLRTLSILRNAAENVFKRRGHKVDFNAIPLDDPEALRMFQEGATTGVFQFESTGMRSLLKSLNVDRFSVIADCNALYRPGPMDLIPEYTAAQTGQIVPHYDHPVLEPILGDTFGIIVYQEQMMTVFRDMGGFTYAEADLMRKIVGKKLGPDEFAKHEDDFVNGAIAKGIDAAIAKKVFKKMVSFAGYAFNKSHAVAYSVIAFWCAYMKAHYPAEFYAAHISNSDEGQTMLAVSEAAKQGIKVRMPDINDSDAYHFYVLNDTTLQAPLCAIKGIGEKAATLIVQARNGLVDHQGLAPGESRTGSKGAVTEHDPALMRAGQFIDDKDFTTRIYKRVCNKKVQNLLERTGALPWSKVDDDEIRRTRIEVLGHIFKEQIAIDPEETLKFGALEQSELGKRVFMPLRTLAKANHKVGVLPNYGQKPRLMLIFDKPGWQDENAQMMGHDKAYEYVRKLLQQELGMSKRDLYITSFYKMREPAMGFDTVHEDCARLLQQEFDILDPPLVMAFGKNPIEFCAGKGSGVNENHARVVMKGTVPVICCKSPFSVLMEMTRENIDNFARAFETLKGMY